MIKSSVVRLGYTSASSVFRYAWSCMMLEPLYGGTCNGFVATASSKVVLKEFSLVEGVYRVNVSVSDKFGDSLIASVKLTIMYEGIPDIWFDAIRMKYNPSEKIMIAANIRGENQPVSAC